MPVEDFGFERILMNYKHIVIDTSALFYNFRVGMSRKQQSDFRNAARNPDIQARLRISRETLDRSIDFNNILSVLLEEEKAFRILEGVNQEYPGTEIYYAKRAVVSLIRERLVVPYRHSTDSLQRTLEAKAKRLGRNAARRLKELESDPGLSGKLSPVDRRVLAFFIYHSEKGEASALLTRDTEIIKAGSALVGKLKPKSRGKKCDIFTMLETDRFKKAAVKNRRVVTVD